MNNDRKKEKAIIHYHEIQLRSKTYARQLSNDKIQGTLLRLATYHGQNTLLIYHTVTFPSNHAFTWLV